MTGDSGVYTEIYNRLKYMQNNSQFNLLSDNLDGLYLTLSRYMHGRHPSKIEKCDIVTCKHSINTCIISRLIANNLKLDAQSTCNLVDAAILHDIGKNLIPYALLSKTGKLQDYEYEILKKHVKLGIQIIECGMPISEYANIRNVISIISEHHERLDGTGYPLGLKKSEFSGGILSEILQVADSFEAMTSSRSYNKRKSDKQAIEELISCRGGLNQTVSMIIPNILAEYKEYKIV